MKNYFLKLNPVTQDFILASTGVCVFFAIVFITWWFS